MDLGRIFPVSNVLVRDFKALFSDTKEADILNCCGLPLKGVKLVGVSLRYMEN